MCGRFTQYNSREEYLAFLGEEAERDIPYDPEPVGRYNVAPGTRVLLLVNAARSCILILFTGVMRRSGGTSPL
jgi:putative SOS response-associated peptidase YedK